MSTVHSHHALGIAEVLTLVAQNLPPPALAYACRVNKSWFPVFAGELWRTILEVPTRRGREEFISGLPRYAIYIRVLHWPRSWQPLFSIGPTCTHLTTIRFPPLTAVNVLVAVEFIRQNKGLEDVFLEHSEYCEADKEKKLFEALAGLKYLLKLDIKALMNVSNSMEFLLQRLPLLEILITNQWERPELTDCIDMLEVSRDVDTS